VESQRLGRSITMSARLRDNAGLEDFMMREFSPTHVCRSDFQREFRSGFSFLARNSRLRLVPRIGALTFLESLASDQRQKERMMRGRRHVVPALIESGAPGKRVTDTFK
jgi:hypothetical protein